MRTGNPVLSDKSFNVTAVGEGRMTIDGVVNKSAILLGLLLLSAYWVWSKFFETFIFADVAAYMWLGIIGGLIAAVITTFKPRLPTLPPRFMPFYRDWPLAASRRSTKPGFPDW